MKRIWQAAALVLCAAMTLSLAGCGKSGTFSYSDALNENGFWKNVNASKQVELCTYEGIQVPEDTHTIAASAVDGQITSIMSSFATTKQVKDRALADQDTVNIDYVGKIDGVPFQGGNTNGQGTEVTIGVTNYIDDFLEQLIGHKPGESFDIEVTFPENYDKDDLKGKDAVFSVTINYIVEKEQPELTDEFVASKLAEYYGWKTVAEMRTGIQEKLRNNAVAAYLQDYLVKNCTVKELPKSVLTHHEDAMVADYQTYADQNQVDLETLLKQSFGVESVKALKEMYRNENIKSGNYAVIIQAIAEKTGITVNDEDLTGYFKQYYATTDYSAYEKAYGKPYLKWIAMNQKVLDFLIDKAELL